MSSKIPKLSDPLKQARSNQMNRERARRGGATGRVVADARSETGVKADLDIRVDDIDDGGLDVNETLPRAWLEALLDDPSDPPWQAAGDARLELTLEREASTVRVIGEGRFPLQHACVRCLRDVRFTLDLDFDLRLAEGVPTAPDDDLMGEGEPMGLGDDGGLDPGEADLVPFDGRVVHLPDIVREQIFLEVPMHPACESEGAEPPEGECTLDPDGALAEERARWQDPRWAALAALKSRLPPGSDQN